MTEYLIAGKNIEFDPSKEYADFYIHHGEQRLVTLDLEGML